MTKVVVKHTEGCVTQRFDRKTGKLISQKFTAGCDCEYELEDCDDLPNEKDLSCYHPFDMAQPKKKKKTKKKK